MDVVGRLEIHQRPSLHAGLHLARYLSPEPAAFWSTVRELEEDPVFLKLWGRRAPDGRRAVAIVPRRAYFRVAPAAADTLIDDEVEDFLTGFEDVVAALRKLGMSAFVACFLEDRGVTLAELAEATGLPIERLQGFRDKVIDRIVVRDIVGAKREAGAAAGTTDLDPVGRIVVLDGHLHLETFFDRARYRVDDARVREAISSGVLGGEELARWNELRRHISWINTRFSLINRLVETVCAAQEPYLLSGREEDQAILEMKSVAAELGLHPSWICRLASRRSVLAPAGEIPLRALFQDRRQAQKARGKRELRALLGERGCQLSDRDLQVALRERGVEAARRTVNVWRKELREG